MAGYQQSVIRDFQRAARDEKASPKVRKALFEAGIVESHLQNLSYGDRDSLGPLQERTSIYGAQHARNPYASAVRFIRQAQPIAHKYGSAGQLAQAVQRSAFPGRYDQQGAQASAVLKGLPQAGRYRGTPGGSVSRNSATSAPDNRQQIALSLLGMGGLGGGGSYGSGGDSLTNSLIAAAKQGAAQPSYGGISPKGAQGLQQIVQRANQVNSERLPYKWGGGHGPTPAKPGVPLDCSGAVSRVLGVNPRVSGQFAKWGAPGRGKGLTVYANGKHVLMEIDGHFFGTSATNPQGGAGWIPRSAISPQYLKNFTARHLPGR